MNIKITHSHMQKGLIDAHKHKTCAQLWPKIQPVDLDCFFQMRQTEVDVIAGYLGSPYPNRRPQKTEQFI